MVIAMLLWGTGWPVLKILTETVSWEVATFWRLLIMSIAFLPILWWKKKPLHLPKSSWIWVGISGLFYAVYMALAFWGIKLATAGAGGMIMTTLSPILTSILVLIFIRSRTSAHHTVGLGLGLVGGMIMLEVWNGDLLTNNGNLIIVLAALAWSAISVLAQYNHNHLDPILYTFFLGVSGTLVMFFVAFPHGILQVFDQGIRFWSALLYLAILTQTMASTIYFIASSKIGSQKASSYMLLVPVFAIFSSYLLLSEIPSLSLLIGGGLSIFAVYWINRSKSIRLKG